MEKNTTGMKPKTVKQSRHYYSALDLPELQASPCGNKIYEWDYLDSTGKLVHMKKNVYEEIQSNVGMTDYKKYIKEDLDGFGISSNDLFMDTSELPEDLAGHLERITNLANDIEEVKKEQFGKQTSESRKEDGQVEQQSAEPGNQGAIVSNGNQRQQGGEQ